MNVSLDMHDDVALIALDDGKKNAITLGAIDALNDCLDKAEHDAKAIVLAGRPGSFCAGFDISVMTGDDAATRNSLSQGGGRMALRLYSCRLPLIAACTGHGFTIGAIWLAACDTRIGERGEYQFGMVETAMGMTLPAWALEPLSTRIAPTHWIPAIVQSQLFDPEGALAAGFIDELVDSGESVNRALAIANDMAKLPGKAYAGNKLSTRGPALERMRESVE